MNETDCILLECIRLFNELSEESRKIAVESIENEQIREFFVEYTKLKQ